jgi:hypothetical protein
MRNNAIPEPCGLLGATLILLLLAGCANEAQVADNDFGNSVRHMIALQTANPGKSAYGLDGQKATLTLERYRTDVANPGEVDTKALGTSEATDAAK